MSRHLANEEMRKEQSLVESLAITQRLMEPGSLEEVKIVASELEKRKDRPEERACR